MAAKSEDVFGHIEQISRGSKTIGYKCKLCDYRSTTLISMDRHIIRHEIDQKVFFNCENIITKEYWDFTIPYTQHILKCHIYKLELDSFSNIYVCEKCKFDTNFILKWFKHVIDNCLPDQEKWFECPYCDYKTKSRTCLPKHIRCRHLKDHEIAWFKCDQCDYKAKLKDCLKKHVITQHTPNEKIKWFECQQCDYKTKIKCYLTTHLKTHSKDGWLKCDHCDHKAISQSKLKRHLMSKHFPVDEIRCFQCEQCNYKTKKTFYLERHIKFNHGDKAVWYKCDHCDYKTVKNTDLNSHQIARHTPHDEINWFECHQCDFKTKTKGCLRQHTEGKHSRVKWLQCVHCDFKTLWQKSLTLHQTTHLPDDEINWFKCDHCDYKSKTIYRLRKHVRIKHSNDDKAGINKSLNNEIVKCDRCDYKTNRRRYLKRHQITKHMAIDEINWVECHQCDYKTKTKDSLWKHRKRRHSGAAELNLHQADKEMRYSVIRMDEVAWLKCDRCDYKTDRKTYLKRHQIAMHTPENEINWVECHQCDYKTKTKDTLVKHIKRRHSEVDYNYKTKGAAEINLQQGEKEIRINEAVWLKCDHCDYKTDRKTYLRRHQITMHTPEDEIHWVECHQCDYKAKTKDTLVKHIKRRHSKVKKCDRFGKTEQEAPEGSDNHEGCRKRRSESNVEELTEAKIKKTD